MRSIFITLLIAFITAALGAIALWQFRDGNLHRMLGMPPTPVGERIFPKFDPNDAAMIRLKSGDVQATFMKTATGWQAAKPWEDRMDARAAIAILGFTSSTIAEDLVPRDKLDPELAGFGAKGHDVRIQNAKGETLAFFRLGRRTPWEYLPHSEGAKSSPTLYLLPLERGRKSHVYAATGDILPLFKDSFKYFRDHRPFYFNPLNLQKMRIKTSEGELTLGRENLHSPWRIVKPLDLATDPTTMKSLLERLFEFQAIKLSDRSEVTIPTEGVSSHQTEIGISDFGSTNETVLQIFPAEDANARTVQAIVSDRPNTVFHLPLKSEPDLISISDLPLTVNELREATLTNLNIASIRGIAIESVASPMILVSREPPAPWIATVNNKEQIANEQRLFELLKAVTETRALSFVTDSAPEDLSPWGLDRPVLKLTFLAKNNQALSIHFGLDAKGSLYAMRKGSTSIMSLDVEFLQKIAVRQHEWRHARLGSFNRVDITTVKRQQIGMEPLDLKYQYVADKWEASVGGNDVTGSLDQLKANFLIGVIESLEVASWLSENDEEAAAALEAPLLTYEITQKVVDEFGGETGQVTEVISIGVNKANGKIYGKKSSENLYFTLPDETVLKLSIPLLDE
ncbi:MAG: DUF4340 domain-containing protein [Verrucomicrobiota bacterium]